LSIFQARQGIASPSGAGDELNENGSNKKARMVWSVEMHQKFVNAVNQLGVDSECDWWQPHLLAMS
jgi:hypothetical protein